MTTFRILVASSAAALTLVAGGCGGSSEESRSETTRPATTTHPADEDVTTTEPVPEPITAGETRWLEEVESYSERLERDVMRGGAITHARMRRSAKLYAGCRPMLRKAGDPGRFEPARRIAQRGCDRLEKADRLLGKAIAASGPGGSVVADTPEAAQFDRALNGAYEATGNAQYDLQEAIGRAEEIKRTFGS